MAVPAPPRRKLIEVDLPLDGINRGMQVEPTTSGGHPWRLHQWWARRPLAACRAVIFASLVDDPSAWPKDYPTENAQLAERQRLHDVINRLVAWENVQLESQDGVLEEARREIARSLARGRDEPPPTESDAVLAYLRKHAPPLHDPFAGGGSIPLEAQRLGLCAVASDLNPMAVLTNKALIELPPKFRNQPPVNPDADRMGMTVGNGRKARRVAWRGAAGLAADVRYYARWMNSEAKRRIGYLFPTAKLPDGNEAAVFAWLWARTIPCPNPACGVHMPLMKTFQLSKKGNPHWTRPVVDRPKESIRFVVQDHDDGVPAGGTVGRMGAICLACGSAAPLSYIRKRARAGDLGEQMIAVVAEGNRKRLYLSPSDEHVQASLAARPEWLPTGNLPEKALGFRVQAYGFTRWHQLFTQRQLTTLTTFSDLIGESRERLLLDGADHEYADAAITYLCCALDKLADGGCSFVRWQNNQGGSVAGLFSRQAISMIWDFAETNAFSRSAKNWLSQVDIVCSALELLPTDSPCRQTYPADASNSRQDSESAIIVTDPPYYDNIGYADLSDFFYVWLRPLLRDVYPDLFAGILTPKSEEMVAIPSRFEDSRSRFEDLLYKALKHMRERGHSDFPVSIFYAYKQQEEVREGRASTGWETILNAAISAELQIVGTWPLRTEKSNRTRSHGSNALASSVVLVFRPRPIGAPSSSRRQFLDELARDLPPALDQLTREGHIAPTDLAQAAIGPGMQVYSRYQRVETISGEPVSVRDALAAINQVVDNYEVQQEGELDVITRFCLRWLRQHGHAAGTFGDAEMLSRASNVVVDELAADDLLRAGRGLVRLLPLDDYHQDRRRPRGTMTAWEGCHRMAWHLSQEFGGGVSGAAQVVQFMRGDAESAERLARLLYSHFDRAGDSTNARVFNTLVAAWPQIRDEARQLPTEPSQVALDMHGS